MEEAHGIPNRQGRRRKSPQHGIGKTLSLHSKESVLKAEEKETSHTEKETH